MTINISYFKQFNREHKGFVIILSKLSELKNIKNLPFDHALLSKNIQLEKILEENHYYDTFAPSLHSKNFYNIKLILVKKFKEDSSVFIGAKFFTKYQNGLGDSINVIFTPNLMNKYNNFCSNLILGIMIKSYSFSKYKKTNIKSYLKNINILSIKNRKLSKISYNYNLYKSINFCKDLVSEPANILTPITYANKCLELKKYGLKVKILDKIQLEKIGMGSLLSVAKGSGNDPRVVIFEWNLKKNIKPTILVGKGVTFDTGGISLKPASGMEEMITDMGGSAVVAGSLMNAALNKINKPIIGIIGLVENMPDGKSQRPGDIIKSLSGQTIEVLNTDAEGRLILADILTYVQSKYRPKEIIDFATLTGAIMVALGTHKAGLFSNNNKLSDKIFKSGEIVNEKVWRLPLGEEYDKEINTSRADMQNIGTRYGGSITAAQFLQRFIKNKIPWAHLDIAGVSWTKKAGLKGYSALHSPGSTAFGVRLIDKFLKG